jgi:hypothetical protein
MRFKVYEELAVLADTLIHKHREHLILDPQLPGCASRKVSGEEERPLRRAVGTSWR